MRNAPKSCLEIARPGEESNVIVYLDFGVSAMCGGNIATHFKPLDLIISNIR